MNEVDYGCDCTGCECPGDESEGPFESEGDCYVDGPCFYSPNYPASYGNGAACTITALTSGTLSVTSFDVEAHSMCAYDSLTVDGTSYCGDAGPDGVVLESGAAIAFSSDGSVDGGGFAICFEFSPSPTVTATPTTATNARDRAQ